MTLLLLTALVLTLWTMPISDRAHGPLYELLWAAARRPQIYGLVILFALAAPLSMLAWRRHGEHRLWLIGGWMLFVVICTGRFGREIGAAIRATGYAITH